MGLFAKVGQTLRLIRTRSIRLNGSSRLRHGRNERPENTDEHEYGILEGTEEDNPLELEDRVR